MPSNSYCNLTGTNKIKDEFGLINTGFGLVESAVGGKVPTSRTVNSKALSSDITLSASDVGAEPTISSKGSAFNKSYGTISTDVKMNGTQGVGSVDAIARIDHVHPTDTSRLETATFDTYTLNNDKNIIDIAINLEILKGSVLTGVTANIFVETFQSSGDVTITHGAYDSSAKKVYLAA